jgi:hypothetical protein
MAAPLGRLHDIMRAAPVNVKQALAIKQTGREIVPQFPVESLLPRWTVSFSSHIRMIRNTFFRGARPLKALLPIEKYA